MKPSCDVAGCDRLGEHKSHPDYDRICGTHYQRWRYGGDVLAEHPIGSGRIRPQGHMAQDVAERAGITYRQFDYWVSNGWLPGGNAGPGRWRALTDAERDQVVEFAELVRAGFDPGALGSYNAATRSRLHAAVAGVLQACDSTAGVR